MKISLMIIGLLFYVLGMLRIRKMRNDHKNIDKHVKMVRFYLFTGTAANLCSLFF